MSEISAGILPKERADEIFLASGYVHPGLAEDTAHAMGVELGDVTHHTYPDTERYIRYEDSVRGKHTIIIQPHAATEGGSVNDALVEQLLMVDAAKSSSASEVTVVCPVLGYARQDRKAKGREPISARVVINMLQAGGVDRIVAFDLHSPQTQAVFNGPFDHLTGQPLLRSAIRPLIDVSKPDEYAVVAPDAGSVRMANRHGSTLGLLTIHMAKTRDPNQPNAILPRTKVPEAADRTCFLFDDMLATAGTLVSAAEALRNSGAKEIYAAATHGLFSGPAIDRLRDAPIDGIFVTDTLPQEYAKAELGDRLQVISVASTLGRALVEIVTDGSVSDLFADQNHM